ncbi:glycosyltransferase family 87 protein [Bacteroidota bacterium]
MLIELWQAYKNKWWVWTGIIFFILGSILLSLFKASQVYHVISDFSGFYTAGWHFMKGMPLYGQIYEYIPKYLYPPFGAFLFQSLALIPPVYAFGVFSFINMMCYPVLIYLLLRIAEKMGYNWNQLKLPLALAILFSARFFISNFNLGQINLFILIFILYGFLQYLRGNYIYSSILFTLSAGIKLIPIVFLAWLFFRKPVKKVFLAAAATLSCIVILPFLFRGFDTGWHDLTSFIQDVMIPFSYNTDAIITHRNQSLMAAVSRLLLDTDTSGYFSFNLVSLPPKIVFLITSFLKLIISIPFIYMIIQRRRKRIEAGLLEFAVILIFIHLVSSVTWKNHQVTMLVALIPFFALKIKQQIKSIKYIIVVCYVILAILSINMTAVVGQTLSHTINFLSLNTLLFILIYILYMLMIFKPALVPTILKNSYFSKL